MFIIFITIFGFLLRLTNIIKPEGLWNDEYVSWYTAQTPFNDGFWQVVVKQCHMPFYYLYLKPFSGCNDLILRLTSVIPSVAAITVMYLVGKEFSKKTSCFAATITAVLSFLIYYAQEVRFYSLLFLFTALSLLFLVRLVKRGSGLAGYIISSLLILFTHVLGGIYVFFTLCYLLYKKQISKKIIAIIVCVSLFIIPLGVNILRMIPSSQWWGIFSYTNILFLFTDFLSPILTNNVNVPPVFFYSKNILFNIFLIIPTIIGVTGLAAGIKREKELSLISLCTVTTTVLLALSGVLVFITKYSIEVLPILILLISIGFSQIKFGRILFILFIGFHILAIFTPFYPAKITRTEGHRLVCTLLNKQNPDKIIYTYYEPDRFERYLETKGDSFYISKLNRFEYKENPQRILDNIKIGEKVSVVLLDSVSFIPPQFIEQAKQRNIPEMFITFSGIKNGLIKGLEKDFKDFQVDKNGSWTIITGTRFK